MRYRVTVKSESGEQEFELPGDDEAQVRRTVAEMGMSVVGVAPMEKRTFSLSFRKQVFERSLFTQELIALLEAGLSLVETVETLRDKSKEGINRTVLETIVSALYEGLPLSQA